MARKIEKLQIVTESAKNTNASKAVKEEKLRQEGREEVLEWLRNYEIVSYSKPENVYFMYDRKTEMMLILPWSQRNSDDVG